jgi:murein DD-endopeptidase MepM/ murein hydrolase activator NlpD
MMLGNTSLSDFFSDIEDLDRLQASMQDSIRSLERLRGELTASRVVQIGEQRKLVSLNDQLSDQKTIADGARKTQNTLLTQTKNQESSYKKQLADKETKKRQFEREVSDFEAQLRAEIDPNSFPPAGTKVLAFPLENVALTQKFGKTSDSGRLYTSGTHNGIDLRASVGTSVKAAGDGIVVATGDTDKACQGASYGRWVLIQHKNGLTTLYAHLSLIKVTDGQSVNMSDVIGYSGMTGYATGPHLHFGLFVTKAVEVASIPSKSCAKAVFRIPVSPANGYLDPEDYL